MHRPARHSVHVQLRLERIDLPPEGVAPDRDVQPGEQRLVVAAVEDLASRAGSCPRTSRTSASPRRPPHATAPAGRRRRAADRWWWTPRRGCTIPSSAVQLRARRTGTPVAPADSSAARCSRTSPCRARTPTRGRAPLPDELTNPDRRSADPPAGSGSRSRPSLRRAPAKPWPARQGRRTSWWPRRSRGPGAPDRPT